MGEHVGTLRRTIGVCELRYRARPGIGVFCGGATVSGGVATVS